MITKNNTNKENRVFKTSDIGLASALVLIGYKVESLEPKFKKHDYTNKARIYQFIFKEDEKLADIVAKYSTNNPELQVIPNAYKATLNYLKEMTNTWNKND